MKMFYLSAVGLVILLSLLVPATVRAEKIGFVDIREVIARSEAGKKAQAEFKKAVEKKSQLVKQKEADLKKDKSEYDKVRPTLSDTAAKEREMELQKKYRDYQRLVNDAGEEMKRKDQELSRRLLPEIYKVITAVGARGGYTAILDISNPVVVYSSGENNLTDQVISEFNKVPIKAQGKKKTSEKGKKK
ncbi:MAG: OmpH family outer membrane protein [Syntrophobacterales bacterium]|nr:OmpH family outer membrane protein [Syntrophobacterales bacterium]